MGDPEYYFFIICMIGLYLFMALYIISTIPLVQDAFEVIGALVILGYVILNYFARDDNRVDPEIEDEHRLCLHQTCQPHACGGALACGGWADLRAG